MNALPLRLPDASAADWMAHRPEELGDVLKEMGQPGFRAQQLFGWLAKGAAFDDMRNLPAALRQQLAAMGPAQPVEIMEEHSSLDGETKKYLFSLQDGNIVEGVLLQYRHGNTLCVSTQVGCRMGCRFCASMLEGLARNLSAGEMHSMAALVNARFRQGDHRGVTNLVLMGSGEPLDNYDQVVRFLRLVTEEKGLGISPRNISLSTCGLVEGIDRLAGEGLPLTLSLSLHATEDETRRRIMRIAAKHSIRETIDACRRYIKATGRRLAVEYTLIRGLNDTIQDAMRLVALTRGIPAHLNIIPLNPIEELDWLPPEEASIRAFLQAVEVNGGSVTRRRALGGDVQGACGQLRRRRVQVHDSGENPSEHKAGEPVCKS